METREKKMKDKFFADDLVSKEDLSRANMECLEGHHVICANIWHSSWDESDGVDSHIVLRKGYTEKEFQHFIYELSHCWHSSYIMNYQHGTIWCNDGVWFESVVYFGVSEWEKKCFPAIRPPIPKELC